MAGFIIFLVGEIYLRVHFHRQCHLHKHINIHGYFRAVITNKPPILAAIYKILDSPKKHDKDQLYENHELGSPCIILIISLFMIGRLQFHGGDIYLHVITIALWSKIDKNRDNSHLLIHFPSTSVCVQDCSGPQCIDIKIYVIFP